MWCLQKQAERLKSLEMKEGWMKNDEGMKDEWMKNDKGWRMKDEGWWFQGSDGFCRLKDKQTDICECGIPFANLSLLPPPLQK